MTNNTPIESPCRVDKKYAVLKNIWSDFRPKKIPKTFFSINLSVDKVYNAKKIF